MDEAKKKYLEELRKQIDPTILSKMANYLGGGDVSPSPGDSRSVDSHASARDKIKAMRDRQFQERMARRKREICEDNLTGHTSPDIDKKQTVLTFSTTEIWSRIIVNRFNELGFDQSESFTDFAPLIQHIMSGLRDQTLGEYAVAISGRDIPQFLASWDNLRKCDIGEKIGLMMDTVSLFFVFETMKQVDPLLVERFGADRIICLKDDSHTNQEKIDRVVIS